MTKMIFVNLPVADVEKSAAFYEALGFVRDMRFSQEGTAASMQWSDTIVVMLLSRDYFGTFTPRPVADAREATGALIALSRGSRKEVDAIVEAAAKAGGKADVRAPQDMGFMYGRSFEDLDGHIFEPMYMDLEAATAAFAAEPA
ncbi:VOC family protein [Sphingomonas sp. DT-204]|uniref:VOC family protein n=1 Tax=Sphingomonas sp. DT-204 TaxID=3396166 RepID=UPI003F1A7CF3